MFETNTPFTLELGRIEGQLKQKLLEVRSQ